MTYFIAFRRNDVQTGRAHGGLHVLVFNDVDVMLEEKEDLTRRGHVTVIDFGMASVREAATPFEA